MATDLHDLGTIRPAGTTSRRAADGLLLRCFIAVRLAVTPAA